MSSSAKPRQQKLHWISGDDLAKVLGLPDDTRFIRAIVDSAHVNSIGLVFECEEWPFVPDGQLLPLLDLRAGER